MLKLQRKPDLTAADVFDAAVKDTIALAKMLAEYGVITGEERCQLMAKVEEKTNSCR